ncbi:hypothetical protein HDU89_002942 [Geranomyces variabilis]|nr:hypothetical protein HDU89_002942 [Geranomyces variabilis]
MDEALEYWSSGFGCPEAEAKKDYKLGIVVKRYPIMIVTRTTASQLSVPRPAKETDTNSIKNGHANRERRDHLFLTSHLKYHERDPIAGPALPLAKRCVGAEGLQSWKPAQATDDEMAASGSVASPPLLAPHILPLLHQLDIQTLTLRHAHRDLYEQIEHLTAELQLLLSNTPTQDTIALATAQNRLAVLKKRLARLDGTMKTVKDRIGRIEGVLGA